MEGRGMEFGIDHRAYVIKASWLALWLGLAQSQHAYHLGVTWLSEAVGYGIKPGVGASPHGFKLVPAGLIAWGDAIMTKEVIITHGVT